MAIVVSESAAEETLQAYAHPLSIQAKAISDLESNVLKGQSVVSDGNNVFTYLTEFSANMVADIVNRACSCFNSLYPENAQSCTDLYKHLSDFDYIGLFSTPAEMDVEIVFDRNFLIDNAVKVEGEAYYKIIIPDYSRFMIGEYKFGLMYPIEIRIRKAIKKTTKKDEKTGNELTDETTDYDNSTITVMWDTSRANPLHTLESHILEHRDFTQEGQKLTAIQVPIYQFDIDTHLDSAIVSSGFARRYDFSDKFYAIRVFHWKGGMWNELAQTLSDINYDVDIPTAMIKVLVDLNKVEVVIPQIYFNTDNEDAKIGNRLLIKVYSTKGALNLDVSAYSLDMFDASFLLKDNILIEDDTYSNMLKRIPTCLIIPLTTRIYSGTDGITMEQLRKRVKSDASYTVKITPDDLNAYFETSGFTFTKKLDNITDRIYLAHKVLTDSTGTTIASGCGTSRLLPAMLNIQEDSETGNLYVPGYSDISVYSAESVTIQPSAVYKYDTDNDDFVMLSDTEKSILSNMNIDDKVNELNNNLYTYCPFHTRLGLIDSLPIAGTYDLTNPSLKNIAFEWENTNTTAEMSIYSASIKTYTDEESGTEGYRLSVSTYRTLNISDVAIVEDDGLAYQNLHALLTTTTSQGVYLYILGKFNGYDKSNHAVFIFDISSDFKISQDGMIDATSMTDDVGNESNNYIDITEHSWQIGFFISEEKFKLCCPDDLYPMDGVSTEGIPGSLDGYIYLCRQTFKLTLGSEMPFIENNVALGVSSTKYQTYPTTEFETYLAPVYYRWTLQDYKSGLCTIDKVGTLKVVKGSDGKYRPVIDKNIGEVITTNRFGYTYGQVATLTADDTVNTLELETPTITSDTSNIWHSVAGDLQVSATSNTKFVGPYKLADRTTTGTDRVWKQETTSEVEEYDKTVLTVLQEINVYKYEFEGQDVYTLNPPTGTAVTLIGTIKGTYYSSNSDQVKTQVNATGKSNNRVNMQARGLNRKWYRLGTDSAAFNFSDYVGFVIEYNAIGTNDSGISKAWNISYYYNGKNADTGLTESNCFIVDDRLKTSSNLSDADKTKLDTDSYRSMYSSIYHFLKFVDDSSSNFYGWKLFETVDKTGASGLAEFYKAKCYKTVEVSNPWECEWEASLSGDISIPLIEQINTSDLDCKLDIKEALKEICEYISNNNLRNVDPVKLNKYVDEAKLTTHSRFEYGTLYYKRVSSGSDILPYVYTLDSSIVYGEEIPANTYYNKTDAPFVVDPLETTAFLCVRTCTDHRDQEYCNSKINYATEYEDPSGIVGRKLEVGTSTAEGAVYYRDLDASAFDPSAYGVDTETLKSIISYWVKYSTKPETERYKLVANATGVDKSIIEQIISESKPCYFSPWKKLINVSSFEALYDDEHSYFNNRKVLNCKISELYTIQAKLNSGYTSYTNYAAAEEAEYASRTEASIDDYIFIADISDAEPTLADWTSDALLGAVDSPVCTIAKVTGYGLTLNISCVRADYSEEAAVKDILRYGAVSGYMYCVTQNEYIYSFNTSREIVTYVVANLTTDTTFSLLKTYLTRSGSGTYADPYLYTAATVTPGAAIPANTYYEYASGEVPSYKVVPMYYHYTSKIDRTYYSEETESYVTKHEFNINFETSLWSEIDKWPWELDSTWINIVTGKPTEVDISYNTVLSGAKVKHMNTDTLLDENGDPIVAADGSRNTIYNVDMIHCDYKLMLSSDTDYTTYVDDVRELIRSYFNELSSVSPTLLARTKLYFTPIRTFGNASFKGNGGSEVILPLEFTVNLGLHVASYVNGSELNKDIIKERILEMIDARLKEGYLNLALLAKDIMDDLSDNVICVDVGGINGDQSLQTMIPYSDDCYPQLKQSLIVNDDGTVHVERGLEIIWYVVE